MRHEIYGPFEPGESPFRTKGTSYLGLVASFDRRVPGGSKAVFARLEDPRVAAFFGQKFLAGSSYDILPLLEASMTAAKVANVPWREFVRGGARFQAERDLNGVYRVLLRVASARLVVERLPRILVQYFNFCEVDGRFSGEKRYEARLRGVPRPVAPWLSWIGEGFVPVLMEAAGAPNAAVLVHPFEPEGEVRGMPTSTTRFSISWT
jgi:hypothetical protein